MTAYCESDLIDILTPTRPLKQCNFKKLSLSQKSRYKTRGARLKDGVNTNKELPCSQPITLKTQLSDYKNQIDDDSITLTCPSNSIPFLKSLSKLQTNINHQKENKNCEIEIFQRSAHYQKELDESSRLFDKSLKTNFKNQNLKTNIVSENELCGTNSKGFLKIRSLSELISPSKMDNMNKSLNLNEKYEPIVLDKREEIVEEEIVIISSDDENDNKTNVNNLKAASTSRKRRNNNNNNSTNSNAKSKSVKKSVNKEEIQMKSEIDKIKVQRKLTKSTNLKRISKKYIPENQQKIHDYFKVVPNDKDIVKYYDTFENSKPETDNITEPQPTDYLQIVMNEMNRMVDNDPKIQELPDFIPIDLTVDQNKDQLENNNENDSQKHNNEQVQQQSQSNEFNKSKSTNSSDTSLLSQFYSTRKNYKVTKRKNEKDSEKILPENKEYQDIEVISSKSSPSNADDVVKTTKSTVTKLNEFETRNENVTSIKTRSKKSFVTTKSKISDVSRRTSDSTTLEFFYKSLPSDKTESVEYIPTDLPILRRSKRLGNGNPSSAITNETDTTSTTLTKNSEKNHGTGSKETNNKSVRMNKKTLSKIEKSKVRKKLDYKVNSNVNDDNESDLFENKSFGLNSCEIATFESDKLNSSTPISKKNTKIEKNVDIITIEDSPPPPFKKSKKSENIMESRNKKSISALPSCSKDSSIIKTMSSTFKDQINENDDIMNSPLPSGNTKVNFESNTTDGKMMKNKRKKANITCPDYKIIKGTTFAVDAFRFGYIDGITHYFLTHFHADHYIGLKKSFEMPIYGSEITIRLIETMIGVDKQYLNVINLNESLYINDIEITALDANHCPGAILLHFKLKNDHNKCILHTGDFRASSAMESEPIFWNNGIHTIYLDTTYLSHRYAFKPQCDSIEDAKICVGDFRKKHIGQKILIVCGTYVVGKEKVWTAIAEEFELKVWMNGNRKKTLLAINDEKMLKYLTENPHEAGIHLLPMKNLTYDYLQQYLNEFTDYFDILLALRPSGWEKNSKPQYRGRVNIVGIEYSEHSSYDELRRFVRFLQPIEIISTVPYSANNLSRTTKIPKSWFQNDLKSHQIGYQSSITSYMKPTNCKSTENVQVSSFSSVTASPLNTSNKRKYSCNKNEDNNMVNNQSDELIEQDGIVLDATKSNLTYNSKSPIKTPKKHENEQIIFSQNDDNGTKTPTTMITDWMS